MVPLHSLRRRRRRGRFTIPLCLATEQLETRRVLSATGCMASSGQSAPAHQALALVGTLDAGDSFSSAYPLGALEGTRSLDGYVGWSDQADLVQFTVGGQASFSASLDDLFADLDLYLYDQRGRLLSASVLGSRASESIDTQLEAGTYYVAVLPWAWWGSTYRLTLSASVTPPDNGTPSPQDPALPDVPDYGGSQQWNLNAVGAPEAWAAGFTGNGVLVAVVDTGVELNHPDLVHQIWVNPGEIAGNGVDDDQNGYVDDVHGWDFTDNDNRPDDLNGHGTHVAGIIAAGDNSLGTTGVAPGASIMPVRVLGPDGSGDSGTIAAGIRYAADNGAKIVNLSLGGSRSSAIQQAIDYAGSRGVLVVAAAGNNSGTTPIYPARLSATLTNVLSVGAYDSSYHEASFSNDVGSSGAVQVDAPGVGIYSTYRSGRYATLDGTSMAAPHVSGIAALILSTDASLSAADLRTIIYQSATQSLAGSDIRGANAAAAVGTALHSNAAAASLAGTQGNAPSPSLASPFLATSRLPHRLIVDIVLAQWQPWRDSRGEQSWRSGSDACQLSSSAEASPSAGGPIRELVVNASRRRGLVS